MSEVHYKIVGMPDEPIPAGSTIEYEVTEVAPMEHGSVEITIRYLDHWSA